MDVNQLAHSILAKLTGEALEEPARKPERNEAAVALGRLGGLKGGKARAANLTPEQRASAARLAAEARWKKG
jgi:hypothetical protein